MIGAEILAAATTGTTKPFPRASILGLLVAFVVRAWSHQTVFFKLIDRLLSSLCDLFREISQKSRKTTLF